MKKQLPLLALAIALIAGLSMLFWPDSSSDKERDTSETTRISPAQGDVKKPSHSAAETQFQVLSGRVSDENGQAVAGASVSLLPLSAEASALNAYDAVTLSSADGSFILSKIPSGRYSLSASASGFLPTHREIHISADNDQESLTVELRKGGASLSGTISDALGGKLAGAVVHVLPLGASGRQDSPQSFGTQASSDGQYEIGLPKGNYLVWAFQEGYVSISHQLQIGTDAQVRDFALPPGAVVEGHVRRSSDNSTVANATITYATDRAQQFSYWNNTKGAGRVQADAKGHFRISGLHSGTLQLNARSEDSASSEPSVIGLGIGQEHTDLVVYVGRAHRVSGRVIDAESKKGVPGMKVSADGVDAIALTDSEGRFEIRGMPTGTHRLDAEGADYLPTVFGRSILVEADIDDAVIEVSRGAYVRGRVDPPMIAELSVDLASVKGMGRNLLVRTQSEEDGSFALGPMSPANFSVLAESSSGMLGREDVILTKEGLTGVVISLEASGSVRGQVVDGNGKAQSGLLVSMERSQGNRKMSVTVNGQNVMAKNSRTSPDGSFLIVGLEEGEYELAVLDPQGQVMKWAKSANKEGSSPKKIAMAKQEEKTGLRLEVESRDASILGVVLGPEGSPLPDVWVRVSVMSALERMMREGGASGSRERNPEEDEEAESRTEMRMVIEDDGGSDSGAPGLDLGGASEVPPVLTDEQGRFAITGLREGKYNLQAEGMAGSARAFMEVKTGEDVSVKLALLTSIEGTVKMAGEALVNFVVLLDGPTRRRKLVRSETGTFVLRGVDPGDYKISVSSKGGEANAEIHVVSAQIANVELEMESLVIVEGIVVDAAGLPIVGAITVAAPMVSGGGMRVEVDDDAETTGPTGRFKIGVSPGKYALMVLGESGPLVMHPFEVKAGDDAVNLGKLSATPDGSLGQPPRDPGSP